MASGSQQIKRPLHLLITTKQHVASSLSRRTAAPLPNSGKPRVCSHRGERSLYVDLLVCGWVTSLPLRRPIVGTKLYEENSPSHSVLKLTRSSFPPGLKFNSVYTPFQENATDLICPKKRNTYTYQKET